MTEPTMLPGVPFEVTRWADVDPTEHSGQTGGALWHTREVAGTRVRTVVYSPGYLADHWCSRGHVLYVVSGELNTELADGRAFTLQAGDTYVVGTDMEPHRSSTSTGATLFIVD